MQVTQLKIEAPGTPNEREVSYYSSPDPGGVKQILYHSHFGPAVIWKDGTMEWWYSGSLDKIERPDGTIEKYENGKLHCWDGPAIKRPSGELEYWFHGVPHRLNGPAQIFPYREAWYFHGKLHCFCGPALVLKHNGVIYRQEWWVDGDRHRDPSLGPAVIDTSGQTEYYWRGELHNPYGPAYYIPGERTEWMLHGKRHRESGPALETFDLDGNYRAYYYLNNRFLSKTEFSVASKLWQVKKKINQIVNRIRTLD